VAPPTSFSNGLVEVNNLPVRIRLAGGELALGVFFIGVEFVSTMREWKACRLDDKIPSCGPIPAGEDLPRWFGVSKTDYVVSNASSIFPNSNNMKSEL
jgi:hypothetical protein